MNSTTQPLIPTQSQANRLAKTIGTPIFHGLAVLVTGVICLGPMPLLAQTGIGSGFKPPQEVDGSRADPNDLEKTNPQLDGLATGTKSKQQVFDKLVRELDNLIPGDWEADSPEKKAVEDAVTAFQLRDANAVIKVFDAQSAVNPDFPPTDLLLAGMSYTVNDPESGRVLLERAAIQHPTSPGIYAAFARLAINEGRVSDALALLEKMARVVGETQPSEVSKKFFERQYLDGMTDVAMRQQRYDDARTYLTRLQTNTPDNPKVLMVSAELEFKENNLDKSLEYLKKLKSVFPPTRSPETIIASWYERTGKADEAEKWVNDASAKYPKDAQVQLEVAAWSLNKEDFPSASAAVKKAEDAGGENEITRNLKAKISFASEAYAIAESHYAALMSESPDNFDVSNMYALSLIESDDPKKRSLAEEITNRNFRALPDNVVAQAALGYVKLKMGEIDQAKSALARAAQTQGTSPEIDFFVASLLREMKESEKAKLVLQGALKNQGLFLYRSAAKRMLQELGGAELPSPQK